MGRRISTVPTLIVKRRVSGISENAVKTQIWIAVVVYVLVAIVRKRLNLELSLHEMLPDSEHHTVGENSLVPAPYLLGNRRKSARHPNQLILL